MSDQQDHEPYWQMHTLAFDPFATQEYAALDESTEVIDRVTVAHRTPRWLWATAAVLGTACICLVLWLLVAGSRRESALPTAPVISAAGTGTSSVYVPPLVTLPPLVTAAPVTANPATTRIVHTRRPPARRTTVPTPTASATADPSITATPSPAPTPVQTQSSEADPDGNGTPGPGRTPDHSGGVEHPAPARRRS